MKRKKASARKKGQNSPVSHGRAGEGHLPRSKRRTRGQMWILLCQGTDRPALNREERERLFLGTSRMPTTTEDEREMQ